ncbi:sugar phosphate isomerase/epimerase [Paenibacillus castaneae]|uniref:sugar phosphate isomerase/epimerase family protein n=1 Tax=Paenibacillus castaneae TaxID=474957 RepID=UPI00141AF679|nr:sugar phosphate isomerase/epimerase [Paenibacillus castaneae]NIK78850.1 sugar phosphate isomerase/epimerase [Paenibacillus castaneae]
MTMAAGINIFSVYRELGDDYFGTLEKVAAAGYVNIELIGFNMKKFTRYIDEIPMESVRDKFRELGLKAVSVHESPAPGQELISHDWDSVMKYYAGLDCEGIVLPSVWIKDREDTLRAAEQMNSIGKKMKEGGFQFYLHNHAHEFKTIGDETLFDLLLNHTDSSYVKFELDLAWVMRAGVDPIAVLEKLGDRCDMIHQKDLSRSLTASQINIMEAVRQNGDEDLDPFEVYRKYIGPGDFVDLGTGMFDFKTVYEQIRSMGHVRYALVENEGESEDKFSSISNDLTLLKKYV